MPVWVFFYGSYMNFDVLREASYAPERWEPARLRGFDIVIRPRANLIRDDRQSVYGIRNRHALRARQTLHPRA